jgi:hypothetical protein
MKLRRRALTALAAVALLAAGCGVQPTGVIPAGPAPAVAGSRLGLLTLYFLLDGQLAPVQRPWPGTKTPEIALAQLFDGPNDEELKMGYGSLLPTGVSPQVGITSADGTPTVTVPYPLQKLNPDGLSQISCTTIAALTAEGQFVRTGGITVAGPDLTATQVGCGTGG